MSSHTDETLHLRRTDMYPEITRLDRECGTLYRRAKDQSLDSRESRAAGREHSRLSNALHAAKQTARESFAVDHGWSISERGFTLEMLRQARGARCVSSDWEGDQHSDGVLDHCEYFSAGPRKNSKPQALLTHTYVEWVKVLEFATEHGLAVQALPGSWYFPGGCIAAVFTRKPGVIAPRTPGRDALCLERYGEHTRRREELHDEIVSLALSAKAGDKARLRLLTRLSRLWAIRCATSRAQRAYDRDGVLSTALMRAENRYNRSRPYADGVILSEHFIRENPTHPASQLPESLAYLAHCDKRAREMKEDERARQEESEYLENAPPRGVPTNFYIDPALETPANLRKARRLDLEGHEYLCVEEHARWALEWARETDRKTLSERAA
jgi:hypothetical protein